MLSSTIVHVCARCGSERLRKNGHACNGAQRAKCLECECAFILEPAGPRYDQKTKAQVLATYQDRMNTRGITRTFGVCHQTLRRWVGEEKGGPARLRGHAPARAKGRRARTRRTLGLRGCQGEHPLAVGRSVSKNPPAVAYTVGDRSQQSAADLRAALPKDYRGRATRSDLWEAYAAAFPVRTHRCGGKEPGETCHVGRWFGTLRARLIPFDIR